MLYHHQKDDLWIFQKPPDERQELGSGSYEQGCCGMSGVRGEQTPYICRDCLSTPADHQVSRAEPMISALLGRGSINPELTLSFLRRQRRREGRLGVTGPCPCGHWLSVAGAKKGQLNYYHIEKSW